MEQASQAKEANRDRGRGMGMTGATCHVGLTQINKGEMKRLK